MARNTSEVECIERHQQYRALDEDINREDFQQRRVKMVAALVRPGETILDVGCNTGYIVDFVPKDCVVHGIDVSEQVIPLAKQRLASAQLGKAESIPFPDKSVDVVIISEVLEHVHDPELCMREAKRVARRAVIGSTPHEGGTWGLDSILFHQHHVRCFTRESLTELCGRPSLVAIDTVDCGGQAQCYVFSTEDM